MDKRILVLCLSLFIAGCSAPVHVVVPDPTENCMVQPANSDKWYPCGSQESRDADCLNLMETAMKAVDPYLDMMALPEETRGRIVKLWDRAKNSCWSDLKYLQPQHYH